ncbi:hypothetical protein [uncultured Psychrosphaera sp.]|jgi:uncharacterized OB-fold protein|uniref:hypothetical protein n=1 Tax=uncultured Psychrosphaera sp. TaxID=1403522 RepID=UPI002635DDEE|nr:hypothetical protein [uncultured Psychrosphaera sp.]
MAIIKCPQCAKSISDKQSICPHCDLDMTDLTEEKLHSLSKIKTLKNSQTLMTHQAIAMLLFLVGVFTFYNSEDKTTPQYLLSQVCIVVGFLWYLINRVRLILSKRKKL